MKRILRTLTKWLWREELFERERAISSLEKIKFIANAEWGDTLCGVSQAVYDKHCQIWLRVKELCEKEIKSILRKR